MSRYSHIQKTGNHLKHVWGMATDPSRMPMALTHDVHELIKEERKEKEKETRESGRERERVKEKRKRKRLG